jgi:hypothetical protein
MNKYIRIASVGSIFVLVLALSIFITSNDASAAGNGLDTADYIYFRIDTELDVLNDNGVTVSWSCGGSTTSGSYNTYQGSVTDGTASDSDGLANGIVKVASASAENTSATTGSGCDITEIVTATVSLNGWISRTWASTALTNTSDLTTRASQDYNITVNGVADELVNALTLNGTTASATYSGTVASQSYSNYSGTWKKYIAGSTFGGTVTGGASGYVNRASSAVTISATASQSVDFGTTDDSDIDASGLLFGQKIQIFQSGGTFATTKLTSGTVTAGDSYGTSCTAGTGDNEGYWYCPVPLTDTETSVKYSGGTVQVTTETYVDRVLGSDAQELTVMNPVTNTNSGESENTPTPTPTPEVSTTPTPTPSVTPTPTTSVTPTPVENMQVKLYRKVSDPKVYVMANDGTLTWIKTLAEFNSAGYRWADVKVISGSEFAKLGVKSTLGVKAGVTLNIRKSASTAAEIIGKMKLNDSYEKTGESGVWYKINFNGQDGWVHSSYTVNK